MRAPRTIITGFMTLALLVGASAGAAAQSPSPAPNLVPGTLTPALVTGHLVWDGASYRFQENVDVEGEERQRIRERHASSEMSDPRLSGTVTVIDNADRFTEPGVEGYFADVLWGTVAVENDQGTWTGTLVGTSDDSAGGRGVSYIELVGAGAYDGLSAIVFERETPESESTDALDWNGVIFHGELPPDR